MANDNEKINPVSIHHWHILELIWCGASKARCSNCWNMQLVTK